MFFNSGSLDRSFILDTKFWSKNSGVIYESDPFYFRGPGPPLQHPSSESRRGVNRYLNVESVDQLFYFMALYLIILVGAGKFFVYEWLFMLCVLRFKIYNLRGYHHRSISLCYYLSSVGVWVEPMLAVLICNPTSVSRSPHSYFVCDGVPYPYSSFFSFHLALGYDKCDWGEVLGVYFGGGVSAVLKQFFAGLLFWISLGASLGCVGLVKWLCAGYRRG